MILVPNDILRDLSVATDWQDVSSAASQNAEIRNRLNDQSHSDGEAKTLKDKEAVRDWVLTDKEAFEILLQITHDADRAAYDNRRQSTTWVARRAGAAALLILTALTPMFTIRVRTRKYESTRNWEG